MRLFERGEVSFIFLWILNPVVILFYQNCSPTRLETDKWEARSQTRPAAERQDLAERSPASRAIRYHGQSLNH